MVLPLILSWWDTGMSGPSSPCPLFNLSWAEAPPAGSISHREHPLSAFSCLLSSGLWDLKYTRLNYSTSSPFTALALTPNLHCVMIDMLNCTGWSELESVSNIVLITHECWQMSIPTPYGANLAIWLATMYLFNIDFNISGCVMI